ncbi:MAG: hypothetical protein ABR906_01210 [Terracidiphilus sp.]|jgi:hypothetical protein
MKQIVWILVVLAFAAVTGNAQNNATPMPVFAIHQPTIIAFFPITQAGVKSGDNNEALSDFDYYISIAEARLQSAGIEIHVVNERLFQIKVGKKTVHIQPKINETGYYLIAPGKEPHIEYGVMTDIDLCDAAHKYFGIAIH